MKKVKIAIVGSRTFCDYQRLKDFIDTKCAELGWEPVEVVSGGAKGADALGETYAREKNIPTTIFKPEWGKYGRSAGFKRNKDIIDRCDVCFAFWDGESRGTKHDIDLCKQAGKPCEICLFH